MHHCSKLLALFLTLAISSQIEHVVAEFLIEDDWQYLNILCERKMSEVETIRLLADVQCVGSKYPTCSQVKPAAIKSLRTFNEFICAKPVEACKLINATLKCHSIDRYDCRMRQRGSINSDPDAFKIGAHYGQLNCMIEESKDENITRMCVEKDGLKVPQEPKAFVKWYLEEADMHKVLGIIRFCDKKNAIMGGCSRRLKYTMAFCELRDEYTDAFLSYRLKRAGYSDIPKAVADYCKEDKEVRNKLGDLYEDGDYEFAKALEHFWRRYNLCLLKDPSTIDLEYSTALCYSREEEGKDCFLEKVGLLPTERSKMLEWLCRDNLSLSNSDPTVKGDLFQVANSCFGELMVNCRFRATERQVRCLPVKNVSRTVPSFYLLDTEMDWNQRIAEQANLDCLFAVDKKVATDCYNQVADGIQIGERLNTAICNSNQHLYQLNLTGCLLSHKVDQEYISSCRSEWSGGFDEHSPHEPYELIKNCTIPLCGKEQVEKCSLKHLNRSFWTSQEEFLSWRESDKDSWAKLKALMACMNILHRSMKLDKEYNKCSRTVHFKLKFELIQEKSCRANDQGATVSSLIQEFECKIEHGTSNRSDECRKAFDQFKSMGTISKFNKWLCEGKGKNKDAFIQLAHCSGEWPKDEFGEDKRCPF